MSKRSRYNHVRHIDAGVFEIIAKGQTYFISILRGWKLNEVQNKHNPEETDYSITIQTPSSIFVVPCADIDEQVEIANELSSQGL